MSHYVVIRQDTPAGPVRGWIGPLTRRRAMDAARTFADRLAAPGMLATVATTTPTTHGSGWVAELVDPAPVVRSGQFGPFVSRADAVRAGQRLADAYGLQVRVEHQDRSRGGDPMRENPAAMIAAGAVRLGAAFLRTPAGRAALLWAVHQAVEYAEERGIPVTVDWVQAQVARILGHRPTKRQTRAALRRAEA